MEHCPCKSCDCLSCYLFRYVVKHHVKVCKLFLHECDSCFCKCFYNCFYCGNYFFIKYSKCFIECRKENKLIYINSCLSKNCPDVIKVCPKVIFKLKQCCYKAFNVLCTVCIENLLDFSKCRNNSKEFFDDLSCEFICCSKQACFYFLNCQFNCFDRLVK